MREEEWRHEGSIRSDEGTIIVDMDHVLVESYMGVGFEWDPSDDYDYTDEQWAMIVERVAFTRAPLIRLMLRANAYTTGWDADGRPIYDWNTPMMLRAYRILDYCERHDIKVIIGEWSRSPEIGLTATDDAAWAELIGDFLVHMLDVKGYSVLLYYNFINEPNGSWATEDGNRFALWRRGMLHVRRMMEERGLTERIGLIGPDSSNEDDWVDLTVYALGDIVAAYDVHRYVNDHDIVSGDMERMVREKRDFVDRYDSEGAAKPYLMTEAGIVEGKDEAHDQQSRVKTFEYGLLMADFAIQTMRGGQAGVISWMLDDSMHRAPGYPAGSGQLKTWGFWNTVGDEADRALRPWYDPMAMLSRYCPRGSRIVYASDSGVPGVRAAAAVIPATDGGGHLTLVVVNHREEEQRIRLVVPDAAGRAVLRGYQYREDERTADAAGYPAPAFRIEDADLAEGMEMRLPGRSVLLLTTLEAGAEAGGVRFASSRNVARHRPVAVSSCQYSNEQGGECAVDGRRETAWVSKRRGDQWLAVDLEAERRIKRIKLLWGEGHARAFELAVSTDGERWTKIFERTDGAGEPEQICPEPLTARYIRVNMTEAGTTLGYSIRELAAYGEPREGVSP
ncbi:discoidin domain-containing protein [Paenibacillus methanolicus]|uniref:F5/8 type C domain-containing protein n=1 Tax=Paenibacillus methanolicus TaxID=582686 RepID=A0A5S5C5Y0_9BACL|nr:discoidin domain-containing protein [Paenibacillus methanolicus]TYP74744.1 F5/8 type C domain-containing protein [Paenibacillus methanolicus]